VSVSPIFILSAPRSGSTLLQRVLAAHSQVATTSEPWILLPLLSPLYDGLPAAGARDPLIHNALGDFLAVLPGDGRDEYRAAVRELATRLYQQASPPTATRFVDKTPLYHLIVDEIIATFPEGRFLFLFRDPLSVVASSIELFDGGRWEAPRYHMALFQSLADLVPASRRYSSRSLTIRFEDLVTGDETPWRGISEYLALPWEPAMLERFADVDLRGQMGDQTGVRTYASLSREPVDKWRQTICNPVRRAWCARYLSWLGADRLAVMGYELDELQAQLGTAGGGTRHAAQDGRRLAVSFVREVVKAHAPRFSSRASTWRALLRGRR
jgi:hypothetical protein